MAEQQKQHLADKAEVITEVNQLQMESKMETLRSETAEKQLQHLMVMLDQEQDVRYRAVQELTKLRPHTQNHIPKLESSQTSDLNKTLGRGIFGRIRLHQYQEKKITVKDFSLNPRGISNAKLYMCVFIGRQI